MTDLLIRIRENNRRIVRGVIYDATSGLYRAQMARGETVVVRLDLSDWLGSGVTVSSSSIVNYGPTASRTEASGVFTLTASGSPGESHLTITASDGRVRLEKLLFERPDETRTPYDYGRRWA